MNTVEFKKGFSNILASIEATDVSAIISKYGTDSCEYLWVLSMQGDKKALETLYNKVRWLLVTKTPHDKSDLYTYQDWQQFAAVHFMKSWMKYNPAEFRFTTFITRCVWYEFSNEVKRLQSQKQQLNILAKEPYPNQVSTNLLVEEFMLYSDTEFMESYLQRFKVWLKQHSTEETVSVLEALLNCEKAISYTHISNALQLPVDRVKCAFKVIREAIVVFSQKEKVIYGC